MPGRSTSQALQPVGGVVVGTGLGGENRRRGAGIAGDRGNQRRVAAGSRVIVSALRDHGRNQAATRWLQVPPIPDRIRLDPAVTR